MGWSNEFKVGLFVIAAGGIAGFYSLWSIDGVLPTDDTYTLLLSVPSADGLSHETTVKLAGVSIGSIDTITVAGDHAELELAILSEYELPVGTGARIQSSGIIGDRYIGLVLGEGPGFLRDGDRIFLVDEPADIEKITKQVEDISEDVKAITAALRLYVEDDANRENVKATLANLEALTAELALIARQNHQDVNAIVDSVRRLSESLEGFADETRDDVDEEMEKLKEATDKLNETMANIESVTGKIDAGEGTIGALVNDRTTVDLLNETVENVNSVVEGFSGMHTEVYYTGRLYKTVAGADGIPEDPFFNGNILDGSGSNTIGLNLMPQEDFWYNFEINDYPQGTVNYFEHYFPDTGQVYTEWVREPDYRLTFQMNKRWQLAKGMASIALRLGVKEDGGGLGATLGVFRNRFELAVDIFDFDLGSYPAVRAGEGRGIPNSRIVLHYEPMQHVYVETGFEQVLLGARYGYATGLVGVGFHFTDDDVRLLFATLPLNF